MLPTGTGASHRPQDIPTIDSAALVRDIKGLGAEAIQLKTLLRQTWVRPMAQAQVALCRLRRRITELCILRAYQRGRYHLQKPLREGAYPGMKWNQEEYHCRVATRVAQDYALQNTGDRHE